MLLEKRIQWHHRYWRSGTHYVVQLRIKPLIEENAQQAFEIPGHLIPIPIRVLRDSSIVPYEYIMPRIPGVPWSEVDGHLGFTFVQQLNLVPLLVGAFRKVSVIQSILSSFPVLNSI